MSEPWDSIDTGGVGYSKARDLARFSLQPVTRGLVGQFEARRVTGVADLAPMPTLADLSGLGNDLICQDGFPLLFRVGPPARWEPGAGTDVQGIYQMVTDFTNRLERLSLCVVASVSAYATAAGRALIAVDRSDTLEWTGLRIATAGHDAQTWPLFQVSDGQPDWGEWFGVQMASPTAVPLGKATVLCGSADLGSTQVYVVQDGRLAVNRNLAGLPFNQQGQLGRTGYSWRRVQLRRQVGQTSTYYAALFYTEPLTIAELLQNSQYLSAAAGLS